MKRYMPILITLSLCFTFSFAQDAKTVNNVYKNLGSLINLRDSLDTICAGLKTKNMALSVSIENVSKRNKFTPSNSSESIKKSLLSYKTLKDFDKSKRRENFNNRLGLLKDEQSKKSYSIFFEMVEALYGGYNKGTNNQQKELIEKIQLFPDHNSLKNEVCNDINDYRFVMFELARVIRLSQSSEIYKNIEPAALYGKLKDARETEYIDKIPYTQNELKDYCNDYKNERNRKNILKELHTSCPEAFPNH